MSTATRTYEVPEISCDHCKATLEEVVGDVAGVHRVEVDVPARHVVVVGDATDQAVRDAIEGAAYTVAGVR